MAEDTLRTTLKEAIFANFQPQLDEAIEQVKHKHQLRVEAALDKALTAITGAPATKAKRPRKPRADKGTRRAKRGLPEAKSDEPTCAVCEHFKSLHEGGEGECGIGGCGCENFVGEAEVPAQV